MENTTFECAVRVQELLVRLVGVARRVLDDSSEAEDVVQDAVAGLLGRDRASIGEVGKWLEAAVWRISVKRNRRAAQLRKRHQRYAWGAGSRVAPPVYSLAEAREEQERLRAAVEGLREPYRSVILQSYFQDRSNREIARERGASPGAVHNWLYRARAMLRRSLPPPLAG